YDAGFISLDKQFLTVGINGMVEAAEYLGIRISDNPDYKAFINKNLKLIYDKNKEAKAKYGFMFNTEFVPAENLGVKNAAWDKADGLQVPRDCYNSYFYIVEDSSQNLIDK
ncbi:TPA: anaerobic ribonucleoside-triphosphate reductase, partial [Neisseria gonorrhoeae]